MSQEPNRVPIWVGHFREFTDDPVEQRLRPSIREYIYDTPQESESRAVAYLQSASTLGARSRVEFDVLDPTSRIPLAVFTYTDTVYYWESYLAYYVEKYHLRLPAEFIRHMALMNWNPLKHD